MNNNTDTTIREVIKEIIESAAMVAYNPDVFADKPFSFDDATDKIMALIDAVCAVERIKSDGRGGDIDEALKELQELLKEATKMGDNYEFQ